MKYAYVICDCVSDFDYDTPEEAEKALLAEYEAEQGVDVAIVQLIKEGVIDARPILVERKKK